MPDQSFQLRSDLEAQKRATDAKLKEAIDTKKGDTDFWSSKDRDRSDSAHCLFQYPAMMVPVVQRRLLNIVVDARPKIASLFDPYAGSGTSLVSGMHYGLDIHGIDVNPLAVLIAKTRTAAQIDSDIQEICQEVVARAKGDRKSRIEITTDSSRKWFKPEVSSELSKLCRSIRSVPSLWARRFLWVTLAETVRLTSNDRTSTYKLHSRPVDEIQRRRVSPFDVFLVVALLGAKSMLEFREVLERSGAVIEGKYKAKGQIELRDVRSSEETATSAYEGFDLLMTSPPYGDNRTTVTYGQHSYLPLSWIDLEDIDCAADKDCIKSLSEIDARCLGGRLRKFSLSENEKLFHEAPSLKTTALALESAGGNAQMRLVSFYADFSASLDGILPALSDDAHMIWTVGNRRIADKIVPTDQIILEMLEARGCVGISMVTRHIHHKRMASRNDVASTMKEEQIIILRAPRKSLRTN